MAEDQAVVGLRMLAEHLAKVKLEATENAYVLEQRVKALEAENAQLQSRLGRARDDLRDYKDQIGQLQRENSRKWRVQERADWKQLVATLRAERKVLQQRAGDMRAAALASRSLASVWSFRFVR